MARTKMVRLKEEEWRLLMKAREEVRRRGYADLEDLEDELEDDEDEGNDLGAFLGGLALGAIAAVGAAAIIKILSERAKNSGGDGGS